MAIGTYQRRWSLPERRLRRSFRGVASSFTKVRRTVSCLHTSTALTRIFCTSSKLAKQVDTSCADRAVIDSPLTHSLAVSHAFLSCGTNESPRYLLDVSFLSAAVWGKCSPIRLFGVG